MLYNYRITFADGSHMILAGFESVADAISSEILKAFSHRVVSVIEIGTTA